MNRLSMDSFTIIDSIPLTATTQITCVDRDYVTQWRHTYYFRSSGVTLRRRRRGAQPVVGAAVDGTADGGSGTAGLKRQPCDEEGMSRCLRSWRLGEYSFMAAWNWSK